MSIMDLFKSTPAPVPATPPAAATTPGNIPASTAAATNVPATPGTASNGVTPPGAAGTASPLDAFTDLWKTDPNANPATGQPLFNVNQEQLLAAARTQDFKKFITPEQLQAIAAGGEGAMNAFSGAINEVAQQLFAQNALATTKLIDGAMGRSNAQLNDRLPAMIKQHNFSDSLRTENPAFSHAAAQPIIQALQQTLVQKYPNATAAELRTMATQYLGAFSDTVKPPAVPIPGQNGTPVEGTDWSKFLG
jgi:hypothetical protein